jgi:hypothetical protein
MFGKMFGFAIGNDPNITPRCGWKATGTKKPCKCRAFRMRSSGLEPPRAVKPTRPSTLRVYQFRHERRGGEYSQRPALEARRLRRWRTAGCIHPRIPLLYEQVFVQGRMALSTGAASQWT